MRQRPLFFGTLALTASLCVFGTWTARAQPIEKPGTPEQEAPSGPQAKGMIDLAPTHWAYGAISVLMERYRIVGGFPDKTFRGEKPVSRYELAAALAQIMDRVALNRDGRASPSDRELLERLRKEFGGELAQVASLKAQTSEVSTRADTLAKNTDTLAKQADVLAKRTDTLTTDVKDLKGWKDGFVLPKIPVEKVSGKIETVLIDDPEDKLFPHWTAFGRVTLKAKLRDNVTGAFSLLGTQVPSLNKSVIPGIAGKQEPLPGKEAKIGGTAAIDADFPGDLNWKTKIGSFALGGLTDLKGYAGHWGDGIIGNGLVEPEANPTRAGCGICRDMGVATKLTWKGLSVSTGLTAQIAGAYVGYDWGWGNVNFIGDTDHDSINLGQKLEFKNRDRPYAMAGSVNFGSDKLGLVARVGVSGTGNFLGEKYQPYAAIQGIVNVVGVEVALGTDFTQGPDATNPPQQIRPSAYVFVPSLLPQLPTFLVGVVDVETVGGRKTGPGSLLGDKSGITIQLGYDNPILPNLKVEWNYQQEVLFSDKYDGWGYGLKTGFEF